MHFWLESSLASQPRVSMRVWKVGGEREGNLESRRGKGRNFLPFPRLLSIRACSHAENTAGSRD